MNRSSSLTSLLEFRLSLKEFMSADLSDRRSQRGDSGNTPGMLQDGGTKQNSTLSSLQAHGFAALTQICSFITTKVHSKSVEFPFCIGNLLITSSNHPLICVENGWFILGQGVRGGGFNDL